LARWTSCFFFIVGTIALGYVVVTRLDTRLFQADAARIFEQTQKERRAQKNTSASGNRASPDSRIPALRLSHQNRPTPEGGTTVPTSRAWGRIEISSIGLSSMILEGVERKTLQRGVGHIPGTALPGQPGNVALPGHRDTFLQGLAQYTYGR
jgi:sortase (surface protein transpeptidase)